MYKRRFMIDQMKKRTEIEVTRILRKEFIQKVNNKVIQEMIDNTPGLKFATLNKEGDLHDSKKSD